jgi:hypothetical protein
VGKKKNQKQQQRQSSYRCFLSDLAGLACWRFATPGTANITQAAGFATLKSSAASSATNPSDACVMEEVRTWLSVEKKLVRRGD